MPAYCCCYCRYIKFTLQENAAKCKAQWEGREFDDRKIKVSYAPDDVYWKSLSGEWVVPAPPMAGWA